MIPKSSISVSSTINSATFLEKAIKLAQKLKLPFYNSIEKCDSDLILAYSSGGLQLLQSSTDRKKATVLLFVDFIKGKNGYRLAKDRSIKQPLARAVGVKSGLRPTIFDATAGLGGDAFVLASLGCNVVMYERSPIIAALLQDGLDRAANDPKTRDIINNNLNLKQGDTISVLAKSRESFHTIYLDPMYPHRDNSALNKQTMRTIRSLVGDDTDAASLLNVALGKAANRVVVKRPEKAPLLSEVRPSHVVVMKNSRFDIYLTFNE